MKVFIAGIDGYLGWPLALHLSSRGHEVGGADNFLRRVWVEEVGSQSAIPISSMNERVEACKQYFGQVRFWEGDLRNCDFVSQTIKEFRPEAIDTWANARQPHIR